MKKLNSQEKLFATKLAELMKKFDVEIFVNGDMNGDYHVAFLAPAEVDSECNLLIDQIDFECDDSIYYYDLLDRVGE